MELREVQRTSGHRQTPAADHDGRNDEESQTKCSYPGFQDPRDRHPNARSQRVEGLQPADTLAPFGLPRKFDDKQTRHSVRCTSSETHKERQEQPCSYIVHEGKAQEAEGDQHEATEEDATISTRPIGNPAPQGRKQCPDILSCNSAPTWVAVPPDLVTTRGIRITARPEARAPSIA